jgi:hypothetical protein
MVIERCEGRIPHVEGSVGSLFQASAAFAKQHEQNDVSYDNDGFTIVDDAGHLAGVVHGKGVHSEHDVPQITGSYPGDQLSGECVEDERTSES